MNNKNMDISKLIGKYGPIASVVLDANNILSSTRPVKNNPFSNTLELGIHAPDDYYKYSINNMTELGLLLFRFQAALNNQEVSIADFIEFELKSLDNFIQLNDKAFINKNSTLSNICCSTEKVLTNTVIYESLDKLIEAYNEAAELKLQSDENPHEEIDFGEPVGMEWGSPEFDKVYPPGKIFMPADPVTVVVEPPTKPVEVEEEQLTLVEESEPSDKKISYDDILGKLDQFIIKSDNEEKVEEVIKEDKGSDEVVYKANKRYSLLTKEPDLAIIKKKLMIENYDELTAEEIELYYTKYDSIVNNKNFSFIDRLKMLESLIRTKRGLPAVFCSPHTDLSAPERVLYPVELLKLDRLSVTDMQRIIDRDYSKDIPLKVKVLENKKTFEIIDIQTGEKITTTTRFNILLNKLEFSREFPDAIFWKMSNKAHSVSDIIKSVIEKVKYMDILNVFSEIEITEYRSSTTTKVILTINPKYVRTDMKNGDGTISGNIHNLMRILQGVYFYLASINLVSDEQPVKAPQSITAKKIDLDKIKEVILNA